ncbi:MAG: ASCH domain-containing protein [Steroidobacteraceae bacterium]
MGKAKSVQFCIILCGDGNPVAIIERTDLRMVPFESVDEAFAVAEGEGDESLTYWRQAHAEYFPRVCNRLGETFAAITPVLCQTFRLLWPSLESPGSPRHVEYSCSSVSNNPRSSGQRLPRWRGMKAELDGAQSSDCFFIPYWMCNLAWSVCHSVGGCGVHLSRTAW